MSLYQRKLSNILFFFLSSVERSWEGRKKRSKDCQNFVYFCASFHSGWTSGAVGFTPWSEGERKYENAGTFVLLHTCLVLMHQCLRLQRGKKVPLVASGSVNVPGCVEMPVPWSGWLNVGPHDATWLESNDCLPLAVKQGPQSCQMLWRGGRKYTPQNPG